MEGFGRAALDSALQQTLCRFRYGGNTFATWPHGPDKLNGSLNQLNSIHQCIQFTMETER
jgi:hypothetical protein